VQIIALLTKLLTGYSLQPDNNNMIFIRRTDKPL